MTIYKTKIKSKIFWIMRGSCFYVKEGWKLEVATLKCKNVRMTLWS